MEDSQAKGLSQEIKEAVMTQRRVLIKGEEFFLETISPSIVKVTHKEQVGWIGLSKDSDDNKAFAYQLWPLQAGEEGVGTSLTDAQTPRQALLNLAFRLTRRQERDDYLRINPKARKGLAEWELKEFMEGLSEGEEV